MRRRILARRNAVTSKEASSHGGEEWQKMNEVATYRCGKGGASNQSVLESWKVTGDEHVTYLECN